MIGRLRLKKEDGSEAEATLEDDLTWSSPEPDVAATLDDVFGPTDRNPGHGWHAADQFYRAVKRCNATVLDAPVHPDYGPDVVY